MAAHIRGHALEVRGMTFEEAWEYLTGKYPPMSRQNGAEPYPSKEKVKQWTQKKGK
jgi:hypothetical protein